MFKIKRITITDIAKRMSISANTVSKALNGKDKVSEELREKIIKTAEEMAISFFITSPFLVQLLIRPLYFIIIPRYILIIRKI